MYIGHSGGSRGFLGFGWTPSHLSSRYKTIVHNDKLTKCSFLLSFREHHISIFCKNYTSGIAKSSRCLPGICRWIPPSDFLSRTSWVVNPNERLVANRGYAPEIYLLLKLLIGITLRHSWQQPTFMLQHTLLSLYPRLGPLRALLCAILHLPMLVCRLPIWALHIGVARAAASYRYIELCVLRNTRV